MFQVQLQGQLETAQRELQHEACTLAAMLLQQGAAPTSTNHASFTGMCMLLIGLGQHTIYRERHLSFTEQPSGSSLSPLSVSHQSSLLIERKLSMLMLFEARLQQYLSFPDSGIQMPHLLWRQS